MPITQRLRGSGPDVGERFNAYGFRPYSDGGEPRPMTSAAGAGGGMGEPPINTFTTGSYSGGNKDDNYSGGNRFTHNPGKSADYVPTNVPYPRPPANRTISLSRAYRKTLPSQSSLWDKK